MMALVKVTQADGGPPAPTATGDVAPSISRGYHLKKFLSYPAWPPIARVTDVRCRRRQAGCACPRPYAFCDGAAPCGRRAGNGFMPIITLVRMQ
ncbi:hypothetical protein Sant_1542 [Sodalis praecaptivus]|uniref:Uncharacterized protein n=1 Tax=Sodalis praecaptivus TaxID=1239307 RepID=W0HWM3_9GAMM|nr:hypothetical protein Sant_1542 [Sodalis praecaptivus]